MIRPLLLLAAILLSALSAHADVCDLTEAWQSGQLYSMSLNEIKATMPKDSLCMRPSPHSLRVRTEAGITIGGLKLHDILFLLEPGSASPGKLAAVSALVYRERSIYKKLGSSEREKDMVNPHALLRESQHTIQNLCKKSPKRNKSGNSMSTFRTFDYIWQTKWGDVALLSNSEGKGSNKLIHYIRLMFFSPETNAQKFKEQVRAFNTNIAPNQNKRPSDGEPMLIHFPWLELSREEPSAAESDLEEDDHAAALSLFGAAQGLYVDIHELEIAPNDYATAWNRIGMSLGNSDDTSAWIRNYNKEAKRRDQISDSTYVKDVNPEIIIQMLARDPHTWQKKLNNLVKHLHSNTPVYWKMLEGVFPESGYPLKTPRVNRRLIIGCRKEGRPLVFSSHSPPSVDLDSAELVCLSFRTGKPTLLIIPAKELLGTGLNTSSL